MVPGRRASLGDAPCTLRNALLNDVGESYPYLRATSITLASVDARSYAALVIARRLTYSESVTPAR